MDDTLSVPFLPDPRVTLPHTVWVRDNDNHVAHGRRSRIAWRPKTLDCQTAVGGDRKDPSLPLGGRRIERRGVDLV
jgi:hypothetical protein